MSHCINPICHHAANQGDYCNSCGTELILNHRYRVLKPLTNSEAAASGFGYIYEIIEGAQSKILKVLLSTHNNDANMATSGNGVRTYGTTTTMEYHKMALHG